MDSSLDKTSDVDFSYGQINIIIKISEKINGFESKDEIVPLENEP